MAGQVRRVASIKRFVRQDGANVLYIDLLARGSYYARLRVRQADGSWASSWQGGSEPSAEILEEVDRLVRQATSSAATGWRQWTRLPQGQPIYPPFETAGPQPLSRRQIESGEADEMMDHAGPDYTTRHGL